AVPVPSSVASGTIRTLDLSAAEKMPGVRAILHADNIGKLYKVTDSRIKVDEKRPPFADREVRYYGQYVAAVIAETFEQGTAAADAVKVTYDTKPLNVSEELEPTEWKTESERGDTEQAFDGAPVTVDETYVTPVETHVAIELHGTVATFENGGLTLYETS